MFKKPLSDLKTSAPLRGSDRRKLKQRVLTEFSAPAEEGDALVPEGLQSQKFSTHLNEPGIVYLSSDGDPLWFTLGKGSDALIPTVYTLWKQPNLLPILTTPAPVIPKLVGGADLMIPGVVQHSASLQEGQLVSISQYERGPSLGYPVAVGRMAVGADKLSQAADDDVKGKATYVLHTWKDFLWDMGSSKKLDLPGPRAILSSSPDGVPGTAEDESASEERTAGDSGTAKEAHENTIPGVTPEQEGQKSPDGSSINEPVTQQIALVLSPTDASSCLRSALLQAISTSLKSLPPSAFPMTASVFWTSHVMPARPVQVLTADGYIDASTVDIKHSTHKNVKAFLKASAKEGLLKLKETKGDVVVTAIVASHPAVVSHRSHGTVQSLESKREKTEERERKEKEAEEKRRGEIQVRELWKPFGSTIAWFVSAEKDTSELYTMTDIRDIFNSYVSAKQLINAHEQQYINIAEDDALARAVSNKNEDTPEFLKRDDALRRIRENMQRWYETRTEGCEPVRKKGQVNPVQVTVKMRQGRKAVTLITGFELFALEADELAEELRKVCSSSTSVSPLQGKATGMEVMVQGKQIKAVTDLLVAKGVPKKWIEGADVAATKKK